MGDSEILVRCAEPGDMASIVGLWRKLSEERAKADRRYAIRPDAPSIWEEWARERLRDGSSIVLVAQDGDGYIGYLVGYVAESKPIYEQRHYARISDLFISPECRRKHLGTKLVEEAVQFFRGRDLRYVCINVQVGFDPFYAFCEKLGFGDDIVHNSLVGMAMWKQL